MCLINQEKLFILAWIFIDGIMENNLERFLDRSKNSKTLVKDSEKCAACGVCELACSLVHEGSTSRTFSRINVNYEPFRSEVEFEVCEQCKIPSCYLACPLQDEALCIDTETGVKYIDVSKCIGCGECVEACPFDPPKIKFDESEEIAYKCDLCIDRDAGPACVEYCPSDALEVGEV